MGQPGRLREIISAETTFPRRQTLWLGFLFCVCSWRSQPTSCLIFSFLLTPWRMAWLSPMWDSFTLRKYKPRPTHFTFQSDFCKNLQLRQPLATSSEKQDDICPPKCCCNSFLWWPEPQSGNIGHLYSDEKNAIEFFSFLIQGNAELVTQPCHVSFRKLGAVFLEV